MTPIEIEQAASSIPNLTNYGAGLLMVELTANTSDTATICEVGTLYGHLAAMIALACVDSARKVFVVDHMIGGQCDFPEGSKCIYMEAIEHWKRLGVWDRIVPFPMRSAAALKLFEILKPSIELLFLDGDHNTEPVFQELFGFDQFIPVGGRILGDDCMTATGSLVDFEIAWNRNDTSLLHPQGVSMGVWRFFRDNDRYQLMSNLPENVFGFIKVK